MSAETWRVRLPWGDTFLIRFDLARSESAIQANWDPDEDPGSWSSTPYQCADARHDVRRAVRRVIGWCGRDFYAAPHDSRESEETLDEVMSHVQITEME